MAQSAEEAAAVALDEVVSKPPQGIVLPPKDIRLTVERTAGYVVRNGLAFEERIRKNEGTNPRFTFVNPDDAYFPYYTWRLSEIKEGRGTDVAAGRVGDTAVTQQAKPKGPEQPPDFLFSARMPNINAQDFEVVKLTALFVAKNGRSWMTQLSQREAGNYQFDFLRPQHSLYQFFTRLIDQYHLLLTGSTVEDGKPEKARIAELEENAKNKFNVLGQAKKRAEWVKYQEAQKAKKEELEESERLAYAQIDWHDFSLVGEITFGPEDEQIELPPPTSLNDLQSASLEQKGKYKLAIEEKPPTDDTPYYNATMAAPPPMFFPGPPPPMLYPQHPQQAQPQQPPPQMVQTNEEEVRIQERQAERERTNQAMAAAKAAPGPMRIVSGAAPRAAAARRRNIPMAQCPNCKQQIPYDELDQHMKIELLDPRWREQKAKEQQRAATTNISTQDVANNLKRLASQRTDVFDQISGQAISVEEEERRKRAMHDVTPTTAAPPLGMGQGMSVEEQIRLIHQRAAHGQ